MNSSRSLPKPVSGEAIYIHISSYLNISSNPRNYHQTNEILLIIPGSDGDLEQLIESLKQYEFSHKQFGYMHEIRNGNGQRELIIVSRDFSQTIAKQPFNIKLTRAEYDEAWENYLKERRSAIEMLDGYYSGQMNLLASGVSIEYPKNFSFIPDNDNVLRSKKSDDTSASPDSQTTPSPKNSTLKPTLFIQRKSSRYQLRSQKINALNTDNNNNNAGQITTSTKRKNDAEQTAPKTPKLLSLPTPSQPIENEVVMILTSLKNNQK